MGNMNGRMENLEREVENLRDGQKDIEKLFIERITKLA